ncbi:MAG: hypothetical protein WBQ86_09550 [Candidatus Binatus sp.]
MSTCAIPCEKKGHVDLRVHHTIPDVQPPLPGLPQKLPIPWPGVIRDGIAATGWDHCASCRAPMLRFPGDPEDLFCSEC